jgi:tetratricopeptide (TPR) repeat protein
MSKQIEAERDVTSRSFDAASKSTEHFISWFGILGGIGSLLGGIFVFLSWHTSRKDYQHEREFYERRMKSMDNIKDVEAFQQQQLGNQILARSDEMLARQIESISKLGGVIDLVKKTFDMQLNEHKDIETITTAVAGFKQHFQGQYEDACTAILSLKNLSRMQWTSLTDHELALTAGARRDFRSIPESMFAELTKKDRYQFAQVCQLLGVSAFYSNDINAAERLLHRAQLVYKENASRPEDLFPRAFCAHYCGLIEKNWLKEGRALEANLAEAKRYLEEASQILSDVPGEFLTPITYCEVLSYVEQNRAATAERLKDQIARLTILQESKGLNSNQVALLGRVHLLLGNLHHHAKEYTAAIEEFKLADSITSRNYYAWCSIGFALKESGHGDPAPWFIKALEEMTRPGAKPKREISSAMLHLAWGMIAAHLTQNEELKSKFQSDLVTIEAESRRVGGREPLFFSPLTKNLCTFEILKQDLADYFAPKVSRQVAG